MLIGDSKFYAEIAAGMVEEFALSSGKLDNVRVWFNNKVRASVKAESILPPCIPQSGKLDHFSVVFQGPVS
jgi:hypothetical protein